MANTVEEKINLSPENCDPKNNVDVKIRSYPTKGSLRVKQPAELMIQPESDPEQFYPVDPAAKFGPRVTAQQLTRALENLQSSIRNLRRSGSDSVSMSEESQMDVQRDLESEMVLPAVNVGTR